MTPPPPGPASGATLDRDGHAARSETAGQIEPVYVHFEDLDAMGVVHNGRYVLLIERALESFWTREGWPFDPSQPHFADIFFVVKQFGITYHIPITSVGPVGVQLWIDRLGSSSVVYGFRVLSADGSVVHAECRRVQVRIDPATMRPAPIGAALREACRVLLVPGADVGGAGVVAAADAGSQ
ncbi:MAG TPA: thioesterase family protein [Actinocrinis sp.]|nr:thioesterase family protein [Actinocrinis sp.]